MKVLITGGSGFIGRNLAESLSVRHKVLAPSSEELNLTDEGSVRKYFRRRAFDVVIHCATWDAKWNSSKEAAKILDHNLRMFINLVRERGRFGKLISLGSGAEFSRPDWMPRMTEDFFDTHVPADPYGFSKYLINKQIEQTSGAVNLRLFGVFGPHEDWRTRFISNAICRAMYGLPVTVIRDARFDYLYIDDLSKIVEWFINHEPSHKAYNICTGRTYRLSELAAMVLAAIGKDLPVEIMQKGLGREYSGDNARLREEMGELTFTPMKQAVKSLANWYLAHMERIPRAEIERNKVVSNALKKAGGK